MSSISQSLLGNLPIPVWVALGILGSIITWKSSNIVAESTSKISTRFGLSQAIQGGVIAAVATSFPELAIIVISVLVLGQFGIGAGALIGTAIFNLLVIPSIVTIYTGDTHTNKGIVYRDSVFYVVSILGFFAVLALGTFDSEGIKQTEVTPVMGIGMILIYVVYIALLFSKRKEEESVEKDKSISTVKQTGIMTGSLLLVLVGVELMLAMTLEVSEFLNAPEFLVSVTILSILSSFPDLLIGIEMGEEDERKAAISNVFGTNTFNFLVVLPIGAILAGGVTLGFITAFPLVIFLFYNTLVVVLVAVTDFEITQPEAYFLLLLYILFLVWMGAESFGITEVLTEQTIRSVI